MVRFVPRHFEKRRGPRCLRPRAGLAPILWLMALSLGPSTCLFGGQSGDDVAFGGCDTQRTPVEDQQSSPVLRLRPADVLLAYSVERSSPATWSVPPLEWDWNASGKTDLVISLSRGEGSAVEESGCNTRLLIPVRVALATADGALRESFTAQLEAAALDSARVSTSLDGAALGGRLRVRSPTSVSVTLALQATFSTHGDSGTISGLSNSDSPLILSWPAESK